jgi:Ca-activated chloride channel homolog
LIFEPMADPAIIAGGVGVALALAVWRAIRARSLGSALAWIGRISMVLLVAAMLLRPALPVSENTAHATSADVIFVVDTTASINAEDWKDGATRLDGIRADVGSLVKELAGARFELITFDRAATVRVPMTSDAAAVLTAITVLQPEISVYATGSSIGRAAKLLKDQLRMAEKSNPERSRAVFYFGDGEQTVATAPESFESSALFLGGGKVFGYGGKDGAAMRMNDGRIEPSDDYITNPATGRPAISKPDPANLKTIAGELNVPFEMRTADSTATAGELRTNIVSADRTTAVQQKNELYWVAALAVFALLVVDLSLMVTRLIASARIGSTR